MYSGRDMTELSMIAKSEWTESELAHFHRSLRQMVPYLNIEGQTIHSEIIKEIMDRGGLNKPQTTSELETTTSFE